jgi:hypothetical protein
MCRMPRSFRISISRKCSYHAKRLDLLNITSYSTEQKNPNSRKTSSTTDILRNEHPSKQTCLAYPSPIPRLRRITPQESTLAGTATVGFTLSPGEGKGADVVKTKSERNKTRTQQQKTRKINTSKRLSICRGIISDRTPMYSNPQSMRGVIK